MHAVEGTRRRLRAWMRARIALGVVAPAVPCAASETEERPALGVLAGVRHERGIETKGLSTFVAQGRFGRLRTASGVRFSHGEHGGLSAVALESSVRIVETWRASAKLTLQHEQWSDWEIGENRALFGAELKPLSRVTLELGAARRWPVFDPARYASPFVWNSPVPAWTLYYDLDVVLVEHPRVEAWMSVSNRDRFSVAGSDYIGAHLFTAPVIQGPLRLLVHWSTTVQGIVPIAFFTKDLTFELGALYQP